MKTESIRLYEDREDVTLTPCLISETGEMHAQGKRPAVLICPGGAYLSCSDREAEPVALQFMAMGYHAFVLRYSVFFGTQQGWPDLNAQFEVKQDRVHPAPVREIGMAMKLIHDRAEEWNVDTGRIAVCGFSAGGHNAAMYSVYWDKPLITDYLGVDSPYIRPAAAILGYPLTDYCFMDGNDMNDFDRKFFNTSNLAFLGTEQPSREQLEQVSPAHLVTENVPPTFLWATAADSMVPVQHSLLMAGALADHKVPFEIHIFEEGDHGLSVATQISAVSQTMINADASGWIPLAGAWLMKRFALDLPERTPFEEQMAEQAAKQAQCL